MSVPCETLLLVSEQENKRLAARVEGLEGVLEMYNKMMPTPEARQALNEEPKS